MKNILKILTGTLVALVLLFACTKDDIEITDEFDFTIERELNYTMTINHAEKSTSKIVSEKPVSTNKYLFKYEVISGQGTYQNKNGEKLPENKFIELESLNNEFYYLSSKINSDKVRETYKRSSIEKTVEVTYKVEHNPYTLEATTGLNEIYVNEFSSISVNLFNTGEDKSVTYKRAFYIIKGKGKVFNADKTEEIALETLEEIKQGTFNYNLKFSEFGESKFVVVTEDSNGQKKNDTLTFNVNAIDVSFTATPELNTPYSGSEFNINFGLSENNGTGGQYKMRYVVDQGNIIMKSSGTVLSPGTLYNVSLGNFSWKATGNNVGAVKLRFIVRNESNLEISKEVNITVIDGSFTFEAVPTITETTINSPVTFNSIITESGSAAQPYALTFSTTGSGVVEYNGTTYTPGQVINNISDLTFPINYTGLSVGSHTIIFSLSNANGATTTSQSTLHFKTAGFNFTATAEDNKVNLGGNINLNYNITEIDAGQTYQMRYSIDSGDVIIKENGSLRNAGILYNVPISNFNWTLEPTSTENIKITFFVKNNSGVEKKKSIELSVIDTFFDYELIYQNSIISGGNSGIEIKLTGSSQQTYALSYNISAADGSTLTSNGSLVQQNTNISLGSYFTKFNFKNAATYNIEFIVKNSLGKQVIKKAIITVNQTSFSANVSNSNTTTKNVPLDLNLSLNGNSSLVYNLKRSSSGGNGSFSIPDNSVVNQGSTSFTYTPTTKGTHNLIFVVKDNFNNSTTITKSINVINPIPVITSTSYTRYDKSDRKITFPFGGTREDCQLNIVLELKKTSSSPITTFRVRKGNSFMTPEQQFVYFPEVTIGGTVQAIKINNVGRIIIKTSDTDIITYNSGELKIDKAETYEIQIKDSDGLWSNWVQISAPSSYPT